MNSEATQSNNETISYVAITPSTFSKVAYSVTASVALVGNLCVVYMFACCRKLLENPHNRCILNLALADILTALSLFSNPKFVLDETFYRVSSQTHVTRELYCRLVWSHYLPFSLGITSLYTCVVLSLERWLAVRKSFFYKNRFTTWHMNVLIMGCWIAGFASEVPVTFITIGVYDNASMICRWDMQNNLKSKVISIALFLAHSLVPFTLIFAAYVDVFRAIRASLRFVATAGSQSLSNLQRLKKVTQMTAITSFILLLCWFPCQFYFLLSTLGYAPIPLRNNPDDVHNIILGVIAFSNSSLNPFIYVFSNPVFRKAFKEIFCGFSCFNRSIQ